VISLYYIFIRASIPGVYCAIGDDDIIIYFYFITRDEISPVFIRIFSCALRVSESKEMWGEGWTTVRIYNLLKSFLKTSTLVRRWRRSWRRRARRNDGRNQILSYNFLKSFKSASACSSLAGGCCSFFCAFFVFVYRCLLKLLRPVSPPIRRFKQNSFS